MAQPITGIVGDDPVFGPVHKTWHHVLRLRVHRGVLSTVLRWLRERLPTALQPLVTKWFPGAYLPDTVIVKALKPGCDEEFDNEIAMYGRLAPLQGVVVPVLYGVASVDRGQGEGEGETRAMVLSDVGGKPLAAVSGDDYKRMELRNMVSTAVGAVYRLGVAPSEANLLNCHVVAGDRVMIVDHKLDRELDEIHMHHHVEVLLQSHVDLIVERYWQVNQPADEIDPDADDRADEEWKARYAYIVLGNFARGMTAPVFL